MSTESDQPLYPPATTSEPAARGGAAVVEATLTVPESGDVSASSQRACCAPSKQLSCCAESEKSGCCGSDAQAGGQCGCP